MNVYDFDKTIFDGNSMVHFIARLAKKNRSVRQRMPEIFVAGVQYKMNIKPERSLGKMYSELLLLIDVEKELEDFWAEKTKRIKKWYLKQKEPTDVIVTASPEFLIQPIADELGVRLIGSRVDRKTGAMISKNNKGAEKVVRFRAEYPDAKIEKFYSDSWSDTPLAREAEKAYFVRGDRRTKWSKKKLAK